MNCVNLPNFYRPLRMCPFHPQFSSADLPDWSSDDFQFFEDLLTVSQLFNDRFIVIYHVLVIFSLGFNVFSNHSSTFHDVLINFIETL